MQKSPIHVKNCTTASRFMVAGISRNAPETSGPLSTSADGRANRQTGEHMPDRQMLVHQLPTADAEHRRRPGAAMQTNFTST